jgi:hypothetical protein
VDFLEVKMGLWKIDEDLYGILSRKGENGVYLKGR